MIVVEYCRDDHTRSTWGNRLKVIHHGEGSQAARDVESSDTSIVTSMGPLKGQERGRNLAMRIQQSMNSH